MATHGTSQVDVFLFFLLQVRTDEITMSADNWLNAHLSLNE